MHKAKSIAGAFGLLLASILMTAHSVVAQSTIMNAPSTDVVAEKKVYFEFDYIGKPKSADNGGFTTIVPRAVVGVGGNVEVGVNVGLNDFGSAEPVEIQPNIKWRFYNNEDNGVAAAAGGILYLPVHDRDALADDNFGLIYTTVSKKVKATYGPRLTGGVYGLAGRQDGNGTKGGAIVAYEQPLHSRVSFVADWLSGKNRFGYVTPALSFTLPGNGLLNVGYSIGNSGAKSGNHALFIYYGVTF
ncbi:MAG: hypothetical protein ACR2LZ_11320 [Pyrinomonadaceae bacterium]